MGFFDFMTESIAIDLGTANTLIIHNDKVVVDEPSIVAKELRSDEVKSKNIREQIIKNSPQDNEDYFVVPKVIE